MLATLLTAAGGLCLLSCGGQSPSSRAQSEVRSLYASAAADARAGQFEKICQEDYSGLLKRLDYLFKVDCPQMLKNEWGEGMQLAHIGPATRIAISGRSAVVFDGGSPDRAYRTREGWKLVEIPRNRRHALQDEAVQAESALNPGFRKEHLPLLSSETPAS